MTDYEQCPSIDEATILQIAHEHGFNPELDDVTRQLLLPFAISLLSAVGVRYEGDKE